MEEKFLLIYKILFLHFSIPITILNYDKNTDYKKASFIKLKNVPSYTKIEYLAENGQVIIDKIHYPKTNFYMVKELNKNIIQTEIFTSPNENKNIRLTNEKNEYLKNKIFLNESDPFKNYNSDSLFTNEIISKESQNIISNTNSFKIFEISKLNYFLLKILRFIKNVEIVYNYTELYHIPFYFQLIFHIPLFITGMIVLLITFTLDKEFIPINNQKLINQIPLIKYSSEMDVNNCSICLETFLEGDICRHLNCSHYFHKDCIDNWLYNALKCPVCRANPVSIPNDMYRSNILQNLTDDTYRSNILQDLTDNTYRSNILQNLTDDTYRSNILQDLTDNTYRSNLLQDLTDNTYRSNLLQENFVFHEIDE